jgi:hypothetical protein
MGFLEIVLDFDASRHRDRLPARDSAPLSLRRQEEFSFETEWREQAEESFVRAAEDWYILRPGPNPDAGKTLIPPHLLKVLTEDEPTLAPHVNVVAV